MKYFGNNKLKVNILLIFVYMFYNINFIDTEENFENKVERAHSVSQKCKMGDRQ